MKSNFLVVNDSYLSVKTFKTFRKFWLKVDPSSSNLKTYKSKLNYIISVNLYQSAFDSEAKDLESAESIQYKKTMLHRYLNDAIEVSNATACSRESEVLVTNKPESSKGLIISEENCGVVQVNLFQKLFFLQNMGRTCCVQTLFWMSETISEHNMFSPGLSLEFSCIELNEQSSVVILWVSWCKNKSFWQRFTCT